MSKLDDLHRRLEAIRNSDIEERAHAALGRLRAETTETNAYIAALEAEIAELHFVREAAEEEIIAGREYLNIAGKGIDALKAENARMRAVVEAVAEAGTGDEYGGNSWLMFAGYDAETIRQQARAILASASDDGGTNEPGVTPSVPAIRRETAQGTALPPSPALDMMMMADPALVKEGSIPVRRGGPPPCEHGRDSYTWRVATVIHDDTRYRLTACTVCGRLWEMPNEPEGRG